MRFNCLKATDPLRGDKLLFTAWSPGLPGTHLLNFRRMKGWADLGATQWFWTWDPWIGNPALWPLGHCSFRLSHLLFIYEQTLFSSSNRATDSFYAQSTFHSPSYTKCHSSFGTVKQNKSPLLVNNNCGCLILLAQKKSSQVAWFHSASIFQR